MRCKSIADLSLRELEMLAIAKETGLDYMMGLWNEVAKRIVAEIKEPTILESLTTQFNASIIASSHLIVQMLGTVLDTTPDIVINLYIEALKNGVKQNLSDLQRSMN